MGDACGKAPPLNGEQRDALLWFPADGAERTWFRGRRGQPRMRAIAALRALGWTDQRIAVERASGRSCTVRWLTVAGIEARKALTA